MASTITEISLISLTARFCIDLVAMLILVFGMYYQRYRDKELVTVAALFNIFIFLVLTIPSSVEFGIAAGFGLFAILAIFTLRSEQISKIEITYFFGSVVIAVICSVQGTTISFIIGMLLLALLGAYIFDHPRVLRSVGGVKITLNKIDEHVLSNPQAMKASLNDRLGIEVISYQIIAIDYVNETARININYRMPKVG